MAEITREQWTPAAYQIVEHLEALKKIASNLGIDGLSVGISTNSEYTCFAFCLFRDERNEVKKCFEVQVGKGEIIFEEDNETYKAYKRT